MDKLIDTIRKDLDFVELVYNTREDNKVKSNALKKLQDSCKTIIRVIDLTRCDLEDK